MLKIAIFVSMATGSVWAKFDWHNLIGRSRKPFNRTKNCDSEFSCNPIQYATYSVSLKIPPKVFWHFLPHSREFFVQSLNACYMFLSTLDYKFLFTYLQLWRSYAILSSTTQFTSHAQNFHHRPKRTLAFSDIFPKQFGIFSPKFTHLLHVPIYVRVRTFIQLSPTMTKLCHIKCNQTACVSADGGHFEQMMVVALNMP